MSWFYRTGVLCGALLLALTALAVAEFNPRRTLQANLAAGKPTVLIVSRTPTPADQRSEAYADWAGYLNDFAEDHQGDFEFLKVKPTALKAIFAEHTPIKSPFATIFFRDAQSAIYYDGMIHDRNAYRAVAAFLAGRAVEERPRSALKPFRFRLR